MKMSERERAAKARLVDVRKVGCVDSVDIVAGVIEYFDFEMFFFLFSLESTELGFDKFLLYFF